MGNDLMREIEAFSVFCKCIYKSIGDGIYIGRPYTHIGFVYGKMNVSTQFRFVSIGGITQNCMAWLIDFGASRILFWCMFVCL